MAPYASMAALLATEQQAGRLQINPVLMALAAEGLPADEYERIATAFKTKVGNSYAATECTFLSYSCSQSWLHVNDDWVALEPVDTDYRPTKRGTASHTVLVTNLVNRVQPILRYDLGDSVLQRPDPCPCGNPLTAIRVQGRTADMLALKNGEGRKVVIPPLAFGSIAERVPGVDFVQIVQDSPTDLGVRLRLAAHADKDSVWPRLQAELARLLEAHGLRHVAVRRRDELPEPSAGGKYRDVIPLRAGDE